MNDPFDEITVLKEEHKNSLPGPVIDFVSENIKYFEALANINKNMLVKLKEN
jgi:hypothetical protein